ncbi:MAG: hypothetical protein KAT58_00725 [candidate division Zixibacteria bacterium]|nr:hypothetical protein [candidate division Zixibacteria bacterium]
MKRQLPLMLVFLLGAFMIIQYFVPAQASLDAYEFILDWMIIIGIFAMALGIWSLMRVSWHKIKRRSHDWQYAALTLAGLFIMVLFGFEPIGGGLKSYLWLQFYEFVMVPVLATIFSLLAFFMASAAYRAFRARSLLAAVLLGSAMVLMFRVLPLGPLSDPINELAGWILVVPNLAAKRAILIGVGLGMVATSLKVILGIERSYLGRD